MSDNNNIYDSTKIEVNQSNNITENRVEKDYKPGAIVIFLSEVLGTAMLMFFGCMGVCVPIAVDIPIVPHFAAIGYGLTVLVVIQSIGHISGAHLNPQVTIASVILGYTKPLMSLVYFLAEFVGALLGFGLLKLVLPYRENVAVCDTVPYKDLTIVQVLIIEIGITCGLVLACAGFWDPRNAQKVDSVAIRAGLVVACLALVSGPFTGGSMNTARSFAPALINGKWDNHWIYWVAPTIGSILGATFYRFALSAPKK